MTTALQLTEVEDTEVGISPAPEISLALCRDGTEDLEQLDTAFLRRSQPRTAP